MLRAADGPSPTVAGPRSQEVLVSRMAQTPSVRRSLTALRRYRHLLRNLVLKDLKLKYRGSVIGFLWSLANPILMGVVYTIAFRGILQIHNEGFVFYLMLGLLSWTFFAFTQFVLSIGVILPLMLLYYRVTPVAPMLLFPVFMALQLIFTIGVGLVLATSAAFLRDVRHLVDIAIMILFWLTPIVYEVGQLPPGLRQLILLSPMSPYVAAYQEIFYYRDWPHAATWASTVAYAAIALALGLWMVVRNEDTFAERV
jgi:lipopolysaccharide transport system permease protein